MSDALAIAAVTKVLAGMLDDYYKSHDLSPLVGTSVKVSALAPNRIGAKEDEAARINLFLYRITPNTGWCNRDLPSRDDTGRRVENPALALDLYYLLSAYGKKDTDAEVILGCAAQVLHETPFLSRAAISSYLAQNPLAAGVLDGARLADQVENIRIAPVTLSTEEASKLWTAFQAPYRSSLAYQISVVLIESTRSARSNLPVLTRGGTDPVTGEEEGIRVHAGTVLPYPALSDLVPPARQPGVHVGDSVTLQGSGLRGDAVTIECRHLRRDTPLIPAIAGIPTDTEIAFTVPDLPPDANGMPVWPAGHYIVRARIRNGERTTTSNALPMALVPVAKNPAPGQKNPAASRNGNTLTITLSCLPAVMPSQDASIVIGNHELSAGARTAATDALTFTATIPSSELPAGDYYYRIRVDGVESRLIDRTKKPPRFDDTRQVTIP